MSPYHLVCAIDTNIGFRPSRDEHCTEPSTAVVGSFKSLEEANERKIAVLAGYNKEHKGARATECVLVGSKVVEEEITADWRLEK
jgi:hypothetical protein